MKKSCSVPQIFKVSYFYKIFINSKTGGAMISINAWDMVHFRVYRVYQKSAGHETSPTNRTTMNNIFRKHFVWFFDIWPSSRPFLIYQPSPIFH